MAPINQRIAERIRAMLAERRIPASDFYVAVGMSDRTGARRLAGTSSWTTDELAAAAEFLGVPLSALVSERTAEAVA